MNALLQQYRVRQVTNSEIVFVAEILAKIFFEYPAYASIFPDKNMRYNGLKWLFEKNLILHYKKKCTYIVTALDLEEIKDAAQVVATMTWVPPYGLDTTFIDYVKVGLLLMPFKFGLGSMKRMYSIMNANNDEVNAVIGSKPHWYLGMVAVQEDYRGKGIASAMIKAYLHENVDETSKQTISRQVTNNFPVILTTQLESNVRLYEKLGFKIMKEDYITCSKEKIYNWCMMRNTE